MLRAGVRWGKLLLCQEKVSRSRDASRGPTVGAIKRRRSVNYRARMVLTLAPDFSANALNSPVYFISAEEKMGCCITSAEMDSGLNGTLKMNGVVWYAVEIYA